MVYQLGTAALTGYRRTRPRCINGGTTTNWAMTRTVVPITVEVFSMNNNWNCNGCDAIINSGNDINYCCCCYGGAWLFHHGETNNASSKTERLSIEDNACKQKQKTQTLCELLEKAARVREIRTSQ
ncbi:conserved hypothetical protein [Ricinus communis]|uniref:Uncharacterized protein n=1 Tax=Ricinus communis TaxID=3988 RepID=B9S4K2_RICCO|nr:conserved hypothetical protein [Ricinus communis]